MTDQITSTIVPTKKRMVEQDIAKALCIIFVLILHIVSLTETMTTAFFSICGPALIFFFIISGYNYKPRKETYWKTIKKRFGQIILPMFLYFIAIFVIMGTYLYICGDIQLSDIGMSVLDVWVNNFGDNLFGIQITPLSDLLVPAWFLKYMMTGFIIYYAVAPWAMSKMSRFYSTCAGLVLIAGIFAYFKISLPWGMHTSPAVACFMLIGSMLGRSGVFTDEGQSPKWRAINGMISFAITFTLGYAFKNGGNMPGGSLTGIYGASEIPFAILNGILGTCWLLALGRLIAKSKIISKFMLFIGRHTLAILVFHQSIAMLLFDIFNVEGPKGGPMPFNPATILICITTLVVNCLGIFAFEQLKKRMHAKHS